MAWERAEGRRWLSHRASTLRSPLSTDEITERGESRTLGQHAIPIRSLEKVARDAEGDGGGGKIKLIIFVGGTSGSGHVMTFSDNLKRTARHRVNEKCDQDRLGL